MADAAAKVVAASEPGFTPDERGGAGGKGGGRVDGGPPAPRKVM